MQLSQEQLNTYREQGYLILDQRFSGQALENLRKELQILMETDAPSRVLEKGTGSVRALHGCHLDNALYRELAEHPWLLEPARQMVGDELYLYQYKINVKPAFVGEPWPWHQDYIFWRKEDGMQGYDVVNVMVFLDEVHEFNGPLYFIPGSHKEGMIDAKPRKVNPNEPKWLADVSAKLKFTIPSPEVIRLVQANGMVSPKGPAGTIMFFDSNLAHGSGSNISPQERKVAIITYNSVNNVPPVGESPRPEFLVGRNYTPLQAKAAPALN